MLYFEDIEVGSTQKFGAYEVTREEVIDFAQKFDPQPFHLDDEAAAKTHFKRLSASGWHSCAMTMRMLVENMANQKQASLGSPGTDEIRWLRPVHPGDTLRIELTITEGRNRQVRRMTAAVGHPTLRLIRVRIGEWDLGCLQPGEWRDVPPPQKPSQRSRGRLRH